MKNKFGKIFIIVFLVICLIPSLGMTVAKNETTNENRALAEFPAVKSENGEFNVQFFTQLGDYFNDHFAFRSRIISVDSFIQAKLFGTSNVDTVVVGTDGWLYYKDTINNYKGRHLMSDRAVNNVIHNIELIKEYVEANGAELLVTIAPNKNTLYDENMPYYLKGRSTKTSDAHTVGEILKEKGVNYTDLFELFRNQNETLYFKRDSHWNTMGAHLVYNEIMQNLNMEFDDYAHCQIKTDENYLGDLHKMVYPLSDEGEADKYYDYEKTYTVTTPDDNPESALIITENPGKQSRLLMYRDSFGNSLYPIFANAFGKAVFSKATPYNLSLNMLSYKPDVVVIEKVERNLFDFAQYPAVFPSPERVIPDEFEEIESAIELKAEYSQTNTGYIELTGAVSDSGMGSDGNIYLSVDDGSERKFYEAFSLSADGNDNCFKVIIEKDKLLSESVTAEIFTEASGRYIKLSEQIIDISDIQEVEF